MTQLDIYNLQLWQELAQTSSYRASLLSKEMKVSRSQLQRYTQKLFGLSPQDWLNQQRLLAAANLLKQHRSVKFVAYNLGFKQVSHFSREFKLYYGLCPLSYMDWKDRQHRLAISSAS